MAGQPFRVPPLMPPGAYKTYQIARPISWWVFASCGQVGCGAHRHGWTTLVDETTELGQAQAHYIRRKSGRSYREHRDTPGLTSFVFAPGQRCFCAPPAELVGRPIADVLAKLPHPQIADRWHKRVHQREPIFALIDGDWRGNPRGTKPVIFADHRRFVDDFGEHQQRIADQRRKG